MHSLLFIAIASSKIIVLFANEHGQIADEMCRKYAQAVYVQEVDLGMSSDSGYNNVSECGIVSVPLIIGGEEANEKEFPHFALIGFGLNRDDKLFWSCGGTLISEDFVLTAAHCTKSRTYGLPQKVRMGMINMNVEHEDDDIISEINVKNIIKHPNYQRPSKYNDIALLELEEKVEFTPYVRPACLNTRHAIPEHNAIAIGFGKTSVALDEGSEVLMKVTLNLIDREQCKTFFPPRPTMEQGLALSMMCATVLSGGKDTCQGDSGGPLQTILEDPYCMYNIIGVTSFGLFCGYANSPAIYTNVSHYIPWIEEIVWAK